jgi:galactonate dehydratase
MKIVSVRPTRIGQFLYACVTTDDGRTGVGEAGAWGHVEAAEAAIAKFATYLEGRDAGPIEHHWNVMHRFAYFQGHAINAAISAIDVALWDLKGQAHEAPIHTLLGGPVRTRARVYGHAYDRTADAVARRCAALREAGFTAVGHLNPFLDEGEDVPLSKSHIRFIDDAVRNVALFRQAVGEDCDLLIELHRRLTPAQALTFLREIEPFRPMWAEDPIRPEDLDGMAAVAAASPVPIATGERFIGIHQFQALFARRGCQFARISLGVCGGITGARKIAAIAEASGVQIAPHSPLSPVSLAACLQVAAAVPNFAIQEYTTGLEDHALVSGDRLLGHDVVDWIPHLADGFVDIPDRSGLGVALLEVAAKRRPLTTKPVVMRAFADGAPCDQ